jgi:hypothetical protein
MKMSASMFKQLLAGTFFLVLFGCKKGIIENSADPLLTSGKPGRASTTLSATDVYVAGTMGGQAVYWKNGQAVILPGGTGASGIVVVGTDVYVSGYNNSTGIYVAMYWKNGVLTTLSNGTQDVITTGIAVSGTDVHISGYSGRYAKTALYWKNNVLTTLGAGFANNVVVASNGDVYIPNSDINSYWKNGVPVTLQPVTGAQSMYAKGIAVQGSTVYVVGTAGMGGPRQNAVYWVNNTVNTTMSTFNWNDAQDVAVTATGDVFISGTGGAWENNQVGFWNGGFQTINKWGTKSFIGRAKIAVSGSDIYICGGEWESASNYKAKYWLNGNPVDLTDGSVNAYAAAIAVQ